MTRSPHQGCGQFGSGNSNVLREIGARKEVVVCGSRRISTSKLQYPVMKNSCGMVAAMENKRGKLV